MKKFILAAILGLYSFALLYIICAFYSATFDINKWSTEARAIISLFGGLIFFVSIITFLMWEDVKP